MTIRKLFEPNSVAVVGASDEEGDLGYVVLKNLLGADFEGKIYPVNPDCEEIMDLACYPSLEDAPKKTQLAVIASPAEEVPSVLEECEENNVSNAVVLSAGFSRTGDGGGDLEEEVLEVAEEMGIRILGPNCRGVNNTSNGLCATWPLFTKKGPLSIISQSGAIAASLVSRIQDDNIGISKFAALGNKSDINVADLLSYLADDEDTEVIALYLENIDDGMSFLGAAEEVGEEKTVLVLKGGKSGKGIEVMESYTGKPSGDYKIFKSACEQTGLISVRNLEQLYNLSKGISTLSEPDNNNTVVLTNSRSSGILAMDESEGLDLNLMDLPERALERLEESLPPECVLDNPLNLTGNATAETYDKAIKILARYKDVSNIVVMVGDSVSGISDVIQDRFDRVTMVPVILGVGEESEKRELKESGIPVFSSPEDAMDALGILTE